MTTAWDLYEIARDLYITAMRLSRYYLYGNFDPDTAYRQLKSVIEFAVIKGIPISYSELVDELDQAVEYSDFMQVASHMFAELEHIMRKLQLAEEVKEQFRKFKEEAKKVHEKVKRGEITPEEIEAKEKEAPPPEEKVSITPKEMVKVEKKEEEAPIVIVPKEAEIPIVPDMKGIFSAFRGFGLWDEKLRNRALDVLWNRRIEYFGMRDGFHVYMVEGHAEPNYFVYVPYYKALLNDPEFAKESACTCKDFEVRALREGRFCKHILATLILVFLDKKNRNAQDKVHEIYLKTQEEVIPYTRVHQ